MEIEYRTYDHGPSCTNTEPRKLKLVLTAVGVYEEIKWLEKRIDRAISKKD